MEANERREAKTHVCRTGPCGERGSKAKASQVKREKQATLNSVMAPAERAVAGKLRNMKMDSGPPVSGRQMLANGRRAAGRHRRTGILQ